MNTDQLHRGAYKKRRAMSLLLVFASLFLQSALGEPKVVSGTQAYAELKEEVRQARIQLAEDEREYVVGDGTTDRALIAARRAEFLLDNETRIKAIGQKQDRLNLTRAQLVNESDRKAGVATKTSSPASEAVQAKRRDARYTRELEAAARQAKTSEILEKGAAK